jgi:hypothetical protein
MQTVHLQRALKLYAVLTLMAAGCALPSCATVVLKPKPIGALLPAPASPVTAAPGTIWLIFVDDLHVDFLNTGRLRSLLKTISSELIHDGDVFGIRSSGPSSLSIDVTSDRKLLEVAIANTYGNALRLSDILRLTNGAVYFNEVRYRATLALSAAYEMMMSLEQVHNWRKAFIYIGNGYNFDLSPDGSATTSGTSPFLRQSSDLAEASLRDYLLDLTRRASHSIVTIFAIDPRGLAGAPTVDPSVDSVAWRNYWTNTRNSLRMMSEPTGGFALVDEQDLVEALQRIRSAMRN